MNTRSYGKIGEDIACRYLEAKEFRINSRNYQKKWGELDIVATKGGIVHFFEVKSVTETIFSSDQHRPEDNVHGLKTRNIRRMIQTYLAEEGTESGAFSFGVLCVYMDKERRKARVKWIKDVVL